MKHTLRAFQRLGAQDVSAALKSRSIKRGRGLTLYCRANALAYARLALIVPKKLVAGAVDRNRIRRLVREAFRLNQMQLQGLDCVVRLTQGGDTPPSLEEISQLLRRAAG